MNHIQLQRTIATAQRRNVPLFIWGPPGSGKSTAVKQFAARIGLPLLDWRLTLMDAVDMRGTPREKGGKTYWAPPVEFPTEANSKGIMFLDELPQARLEVKNVSAMLVLERRIGEVALPPGWWVLAAGNRLGDNAGTSPMPMHLNNRFWHVELETSIDAWLQWAEHAAPPPLPLYREATEPKENGLDYRIIAYMKYRPSALLSFDPRSKESAFASPRSWESMSAIMPELEVVVDDDPTLAGEWAAGMVGRAHGHEFVGFMRTLASLVSIEQILADPMSAPISTDPSVNYALATGLAAHVKRDSIESAFKYIERIGKEFAFVFAKKVENINPNMRKTKAFVNFCAINADYI